MIYKMMYKCRTCGEIFETARTKDEKIAFTTIELISTGMECVTMFGLPVSSMIPHMKDDHYGVADIIGCKKEEEESNGTQGA